MRVWCAGGVGLGLWAGSGGVTGDSVWWERLIGVAAPAVELLFDPGTPPLTVSLAELARHNSLAVLFYSGGEVGGRGRRGGVDIDTGARLAGWREREEELGEHGYEVVGVSEQSPKAQSGLLLDLLLPSFTFLSDSELLLAKELGLPVDRGADGERVYEPLTMLIRRGAIWCVLHPLVNPVIDAEMALARIRGFHG